MTAANTHGRDAHATNYNAATRKAFTLTEILIAIGIMGVGMVMVAALFPAAAKEASISTEEVMGNIICHNSVGVIKARLWHPLYIHTAANAPVPQVDVPIGLNLVELTNIKLRCNDWSTTNTNPVWNNPADLEGNTRWTFPKTSLDSPVPFRYDGIVGAGSDATHIVDTSANWVDNQWKDLNCGGYNITSNTNQVLTLSSNAPSVGSAYIISDSQVSYRSAIVLGRQVTANKNDYQFVIVSYSREHGKWTPVQAEVLDQTRDGFTVRAGKEPDTSEIEVNAAAAPMLMIGSPVIDLHGNFAKIVSRNGNIAQLDHVFNTNDTQAYVITVRDGADAIIGRYSPALSVLVIRTALRQR